MGAIKNLRLLLHGNPIGALTQYGDFLRVSFDEGFIESPDRPTLSLSYKGANESENQQILRATQDARVIQSGGKWPIFFQNLLPEGHNRERLASQRGCTSDDEFELLAAAGGDLMGALAVRPFLEDEDSPDSLREWQSAQGLESAEEDLVEQPVDDAMALAGVVTKFSAINDGLRYIVKRDGEAGSYILKLPTSRHPDLVEIEFYGFELLKAVNLTCAEVKIINKAEAQLPEQVPFDDILAVTRFDRNEAGRVHMEEFAQILSYSPNRKYGKGLEYDFISMLTVLDRLSTAPVTDVQELVNRLVSFVLMGNTDAHLKNWAVIYPDLINPQLAPVYDPVSVSSFFAGMDPTYYSVNRKIDEVMSALTWIDIEKMLKEARINRPKSIITKAKRVVEQAKDTWPLILNESPERMSAEVTRRLRGGVQLSK